MLECRVTCWEFRSDDVAFYLFIELQVDDRNVERSNIEDQVHF